MFAKPTLVFFGSFQHYSTKVLKAIVESKSAEVLAVVTTPPSPKSSRSKGGPNPTYDFAQKLGLPIFTPSSLSDILITHLRAKYVNSPDFFVVAGYGNILPPKWLKIPTIAPLNLHFSLLPKYRGANPAEWAILMGEQKTGVTLMKMDEGLDTGPIITQEKLPILQPTLQGSSLQGGDTRESLYEKLYDLASNLIVKYLRSGIYDLRSARPQPSISPTPYARKLQRADGFISWQTLQKIINNEPVATYELPHLIQKATNYLQIFPSTLNFSLLILNLIERSVRALHGYPSIWTTVNTTKGKRRLKILSIKLVSLKIARPELAKWGKLENWKIQLNEVQLEGLNPSTFNQIKNQLT